MYKVINGISPFQFVDKFSYISGGSRDGESCNIYTYKSKSRFLYILDRNAGFYYHSPFAKLNLQKRFKTNLYKSKLLDSIKKYSNYIIDNSFDNNLISSSSTQLVCCRVFLVLHILTLHGPSRG